MDRIGVALAGGLQAVVPICIGLHFGPFFTPAYPLARPVFRPAFWPTLARGSPRDRAGAGGVIGRLFDAAPGLGQLAACQGGY